MEMVKKQPVVSAENWADLLAWFAEYGRHAFLWRRGRTPWSIFIAENLLRRTRADTVARVFPKIIESFPDACTVENNQSEWLELTSELGFPSRFEQFFNSCRVICKEYGGNIPADPKILRSLPGVGHYITDAIMCFGMNENRYVVDTNTLRLGSRLTGWHVEQERHRSREAREMHEKAFGPENEMNAERNFALLDLAALVCTGTRPKCSECPLSVACDYYKTQQEPG